MPVFFMPVIKDSLFVKTIFKLQHDQKTPIMALSLAGTITDFYLQLQPPVNLPHNIEILFPQKQEEVKRITKEFYKKYYSSNKKRGLIFGINPDRLGAGITGINFTAPKQLTEHCGIDHPFKQTSELSAEFIYAMIEACGGPAVFYSKWFISPICPLGFVKHGKNINYYDDAELQKAMLPFIIHNIQQVVAMGFKTNTCFCIGEDKNYKFLTSLNQQYNWFKNIIPLPHPRFIMQYKRREKEKYIQQYKLALMAVTGK